MKDNQHSDQNNNSDVLRYICVSPDLHGLPLELMTPPSTCYIENESLYIHVIWQTYNSFFVNIVPENNLVQLR